LFVDGGEMVFAEKKLAVGAGSGGGGRGISTLIC
jgi:hypothetical protein